VIWFVTPSRTIEYLDALLDSMEASEPGSRQYGVVVDNGLPGGLQEEDRPPLVVSYRKPFCFATAINLGVKAAPKSADLIILNDDTTIITPQWLTTAEYILANASPQYGLISFAIAGGVGNPEQKARAVVQGDPLVVPTSKTLCFVATLIRRAAWNEVGGLDERYTAYGFDDDDLCRSLRDAGWLTGVTQQLVVTHGQGGFPHSSSYLRYHGQDGMHELFHKNKAIYEAKWGSTP